MDKIILDSIIKIITVIAINCIFILFYGFNNFKTDLISKLDYVIFAGFAIILTLIISQIFQKLFKYNIFNVFINTIINTVLVIVSSIISLSLYLLLISDNTNIGEIQILFGSLIFVLGLTIITLIFIEKKITTIKKEA